MHIYFSTKRACSSVGRALALQARGLEFDSLLVHFFSFVQERVFLTDLKLIFFCHSFDIILVSKVRKYGSLQGMYL